MGRLKGNERLGGGGMDGGERDIGRREGDKRGRMEGDESWGGERGMRDGDKGRS